MTHRPYGRVCSEVRSTAILLTSRAGQTFEGALPIDPRFQGPAGLASAMRNGVISEKRSYLTAVVSLAETIPRLSR